ncbi:hypothetical protein BXO88_00150 [Oribacterium sp. C9]|uniref:DUF3783 domain-containing protein n=1 Tax=Oribacterium sp. C9 TaxID=1943579 RepID=UPI00098EC917|nr:DUF3783 domain-containing protein [Oribacterium sp. C9]OON88254.1 hypothetical protein BXO88_00150 [Oribacterium sp. C9]
MKSILYINKKDKNKIIKVKSVAFLNRIRIESTDEGEASLLPDDAEMLIMKGMARNEMEKFLSDLRKKSISIALKCVETETNRDWSLQKLYEEIKKEHESIEKIRTD